MKKIKDTFLAVGLVTTSKIQYLTFLALFVLFTVHCSLITVSAQSTEFTYQGRLLDSSLPPTANYDFKFSLWGSLANGTQIGSDVIVDDVAVSNGIFTVRLDFTSVAFLNGGQHFIQIEVRPGASVGAYTTLAPRQPVTSSPFSIRSLRAAQAHKLTVDCTQCVEDDQINQVSGSKIIGAVANATNAVTANTATTATTAITANTATTAGNVTGVVAIANGGTGSATKNFVDLTTNQTVGGTKTFTNAPVGNGSQLTNINGSAVTGTIPVASVPAGSGNYIQNQNAGQQFPADFDISGTGTANIFRATTQYNIGANRILSNPGTDNLFAGVGAGAVNTGIDNAFFGSSAGNANTTGANNAFFGSSAGLANTTGALNAFFGSSAGNANTTGDSNAFFGSSAGLANTDGFLNTFFGQEAGLSNTIGDSNAFFGRSAGSANITGTNNTSIGESSNVFSNNLTFATVLGSNAVVTASNRIQLGRNGIDTVSIGMLAAATATHVCINGTVLAACSSSRRYKDNIRAFSGGLNLVRRLRPVTYDWIESKTADLGLIAEDVAEIEPLLVTHNNKGEIQGVKYDQLTVVLINAVKEQQAEISSQRSVIEDQQRQIDALKTLVCSQNPTASICKEKK